MNSNNFAGTYTQSELDAACNLVAEEIYQTPVFDRNTLAAYSEAIVELDQYPRIRTLAAKHLAAVHKINQGRLLELHMIFMKHA